jgi:FtsH-binding integral membrane protein
MGIGTGVGLIVAGAILTWAVELDLPYVFEGALGVIVMIAGLVVIAVSFSVHPRAYSSVGTGLTLATAGAILTWAVDIDLPYVYDGSLGLILLAAGVIGGVVAVAMDIQRRRSQQVVEYRYPDGSTRRTSGS